MDNFLMFKVFNFFQRGFINFLKKIIFLNLNETFIFDSKR